VGQWLQAGDPIGLEGRTGRATTDHLHFEIRVKGRAFDTDRIFDHANHKLRRQIFVVTKEQNGTLKFTAETIE
jgi:murein DD-endopeptidase MepM/ murein hydrolase activator NlpD